MINPPYFEDKGLSLDEYLKKHNLKVEAVIDMHDLSAPWLPTALAALGVIAKLSANWDSYQSDPPTPEIIETAKQLLTDLAKDPKLPRPYVNPTRSGGVQIEWEHGQRYFEVEVHTHLGAHLLYSGDGVEEKSCYMQGDRLDTIIEYIHRVFI